MQFDLIQGFVCRSIRSATTVFPLLLAVIFCRRTYRFKSIFL